LNWNKLFVGGLSIWTIVLVFATISFADTITVNTTNDVDAINCTLRDAIFSANADTAIGGCDTGSGDDTIDLTGVAGTITLGSGLFISSNIIINGPGASNLTVDANGNAQVFEVSNFLSAITVVIQGLTVTGATNTGILNFETLTVNNCTISGNTTGGTDDLGGGIFNAPGSGRLTVNNSTISGNTADFGGGIGSGAIVCFTANTLVLMANGSTKRIADIQLGDRLLGFDFNLGQTVTNTVTHTFQRRTNEYLHLNGLEVTASHPFAVGRDAWLKAGELDVGQFVLGLNESVEIGRKETISESVDVFTLTVETTHNYYVFDGQHHYLVHNKTPISPGDIELNNSTISGNTANNDGGGIFNDAGITTINNSTISGNLAPTGNGGGIFTNSGDTTIVNNSTISNNTADTGGGILNQIATLTLNNSIVSNNISTNASPDLHNNSGVVTSNNSLVKDPNGHSITNGINGNVVSTDPNLGLLQDNGGPTFTHALLAGSPAFNAGDNSLIPPDGADQDSNSNNAEEVPFDQRGPNFDRIAFNAVDIGAFESRVNLNILPLAQAQTIQLSKLFPVPFHCGEERIEFDNGGVTQVNLKQHEMKIEVFLPQTFFMLVFPTGKDANLVETLTLNQPGPLQQPGGMTVPLLVTLMPGKTIVLGCDVLNSLPVTIDGSGNILSSLDDVIGNSTKFGGIFNLETDTNGAKLQVLETHTTRTWIGTDTGGGIVFNDATVEQETTQIAPQTISVRRDVNLGVPTPDVVPLPILDAVVAPQPLTVKRLSSVDSQSTTFVVHGQNLANFELDIFDLAGRKIFRSGTVNTNALYWNHLNDRAQRVPNGVYLYTIRARTTEGQILRSEIKKLMVFQ